VSHNLPRWLNKSTDLYLISAEKNTKLRTSKNEMVEGGDFYEIQVYSKDIDYPSPFCFTESYYRKAK
jgi:hypothetical protein